MRQRLDAIDELPLSSPYATTARLTIPRLAADVRRYLKEGDRSMALRWVAQAVQDVRSLSDHRDLAVFFARPWSTGSRQWDALIAGVAEREARRAGIEAPEWTRSPLFRLRRMWFVTEVEGLHAYALAHTPPELAIRGVFLDETELESV